MAQKNILIFQKFNHLLILMLVTTLFSLTGCGNGDNSEAAGSPDQPFEGVIDSPIGDVTINAGQSLSFTGSVTNPENNGPFSFAWDFGGGAVNQTVEAPEAVTFDTPGTYTVTFTATDSSGLADSTPDTRTITVLNQAPNGVIDTPSGNVTIGNGQSVNFTGSATDPDNNTPLAFAWSFGGGAANQSVEDPGSVIFNTPGTYAVTLTVTDSLGLTDPTPETRIVTVLNQAPNGIIDTPTGDVTIVSGQSVNFTGSATDPDNNGPLAFAWDFGGGAANKNPRPKGTGYSERF